MVALVAPGVCRYAVNQSYAGRPVVNIVDCRIDTTGTGADRPDACEHGAKVVLDNWHQQVLDNLQTSLLTAHSVSWLDLDELDGSVGEVAQGNDETWPAVGTDVVVSFPGNVAIRVNKQTQGGRGSRQGRMYIAGAAEVVTDNLAPNTPTASTVTAVNTAMGDFLEGINGQKTVGVWEFDMFVVVTHTRKWRTGDPGSSEDRVFAGHTDVTAMTCDATLGSQRRRLRG